jgi:hypothetical protein
LTFGFFHESVAPGLLSIPFRPFQICSKILGDIRNFVIITGISDIGDKLFASVNDTGNKLFPVSLLLAPVSWTPAIMRCPGFSSLVTMICVFAMF